MGIIYRDDLLLLTSGCTIALEPLPYSEGILYVHCSCTMYV